MVIVAAGSGTRLGAGGPKALAEVAGRPMVAWSVAAAADAEAMVIATPPGHEVEIAAACGAGPRVVSGGDSRSRSVANALAAVATDLVLVHDAARPLVTAGLFAALEAGLRADPHVDGLVAAAPVADTLKRASEDLAVAETLSRDGLWAIQTPQAFRTEVLRRALDVPGAVLAAATDDAALVEAAGGTVRIHPYYEPNLKITTAADMRLAEALLG